MIFRLVTREENMPNVWLVSLMCSMFLCGFENSEFNICSDFSPAKPVRLTLLRKEWNREPWLRQRKLEAMHPKLKKVRSVTR